MNKKFLALAVAAAMAPVAASADVKLYGIAQVEYSVEDSSDADSVQSVDDNAGRSRIGIKFSEKLGGGLTAFGKVEFRIDPADHSSQGTNGGAAGLSGNVVTSVDFTNQTTSTTRGSNSLGARDAHVGLKGSWGSLAAGSFNAPYKTAGGVKWDPMAATHLQARRAGGMSGGAGIGGHNGFMRNTIYYTSPNVNGFQAQIALAPDETNASAENGVDGDNDYSIALQYKNGPWHAVVAHNRNNNDTIDDETLTKVGLRWKSGALTLAGQYEWIDDADRAASGSTPGSNGTNESYHVGRGNDGEIFWLNGQYKMGNNILTASYGSTDADVSGGADFDYDYWMVGAIHKFSKKTRIFGGYTETDGDNNGNSNDRDAWSVGIRADF